MSLENNELLSEIEEIKCISYELTAIEEYNISLNLNEKLVQL